MRDGTEAVEAHGVEVSTPANLLPERTASLSLQGQLRPTEQSFPDYGLQWTGGLCVNSWWA